MSRTDNHHQWSDSYPSLRSLHPLRLQQTHSHFAPGIPPTTLEGDSRRAIQAHTTSASRLGRTFGTRASSMAAASSFATAVVRLAIGVKTARIATSQLQTDSIKWSLDVVAPPSVASE